MKTLFPLLITLALAAAAPAQAKHEDDHGKHAEKHGQKHGKGHKFEKADRSSIKEWYAAHPEERDSLPPGLAKQGKIPPGWQKKYNAGERIPDDIWEARIPVPNEVVLKLPVPPPPDVVLVRIGSQILKVREKTHEVLDRIGLPHPP